MKSNVQHLNDISETCCYVPELEQMTLGGLLLKPELIGLVAASGGAKLFYEPCHAELFDLMASRNRKGLLVSPVALAEWANEHHAMSELGGARYLITLAGAAITVGFEDYIDQLADAKARRELLAVAQEVQAAVVKGEETAVSISGRMESALMDVQPTKRAAPVSMMKAVTKAVSQSWDAYNGEDNGAVISGIGKLDDIMSGFYPGELTLLGGRPSMGKTALALSMGLNVARAGHGVVICSLEMSPEAMAMRAISEGTAELGRGVHYSDMRMGRMSPMQGEAMVEAAKSVAELPITFLPREFSDIGALMSGAKQAQRILGKGNMRLFIVDYAQLLQAKASSRFEEITKISIALKSLAAQLNVPVLALSQLSRKVEERNDKRPQLADLRESGQLEQDADSVLFCYRDEYYVERLKPDDPEKLEKWKAAMEASRNRLEIIVAKQRQGQIGTAHVFCNPALNRIWEG